MVLADRIPMQHKATKKDSIPRDYPYVGIRCLDPARSEETPVSLMAVLEAKMKDQRPEGYRPFPGGSINEIWLKGHKNKIPYKQVMNMGLYIPTHNCHDEDCRGIADLQIPD